MTIHLVNRPPMVVFCCNQGKPCADHQPLFKAPCPVCNQGNVSLQAQKYAGEDGFRIKCFACGFDCPDRFWGRIRRTVELTLAAKFAMKQVQNFLADYTLKLAGEHAPLPDSMKETLDTVRKRAHEGLERLAQAIAGNNAELQRGEWEG